MYVSISSDDSSDLFPENTNSKFKVKLDTPINSDHVGLAEINFITSTTNVNTTSICLTVNEKTDDGGMEGTSLTLSLEAGFYKTLDDLITAANKVVAKFTTLFPHLKPKFKLDKDYGRIMFGPIGKLDNFYTSCHDDVYRLIPDAFGFWPANFNRALVKGEDKYVVAGNPPSLTSHIFSQFIYTNIIKDTFIGDVQAKLLRTVPVKNDQPINLEFKTIYYQPVEVNYIQIIEIDIRDDTGKEIDFKEAVTLTLHFI